MVKVFIIERWQVMINDFWQFRYWNKNMYDMQCTGYYIKIKMKSLIDVNILYEYNKCLTWELISSCDFPSLNVISSGSKYHLNFIHILNEKRSRVGYDGHVSNSFICSSNRSHFCFNLVPRTVSNYYAIWNPIDQKITCVFQQHIINGFM